MRLDTSYLAFITKEELRVLLAVEMGMRNHELVPVHLIERISKLKRANTFAVIQSLLKNKLIAHDAKKYDGYKLTYLGYDFLALSVFYKRGHIVTVLGKMGVGKESDIYKCLNADGNLVVLKFARLGRNSFRTVKKNRDYLKHRTSFSWLYLSRLASCKEFLYMQILYSNAFPTPKPIDWNRHGVVMSLIDGYTLCNVKEVPEPELLFKQCIDLLERFAQHGLIHSDFNEFNLMLTTDLKLIVIDFPQMVSTSHENAEHYFDRDQDCINTFFSRRFKCIGTSTMKLPNLDITKHLDIEVKASGHLKKELYNIKDLALIDELGKGRYDAEDSIEELDEDENEFQQQEEIEELEELQELLESEEEEDQQIEGELEGVLMTPEEAHELNELAKKEKKLQPKKEKEVRVKQQETIEPQGKSVQEEEKKEVLPKADKEYIQKFLKQKFRKQQVSHKSSNKLKQKRQDNPLEDYYIV